MKPQEKATAVPAEYAGTKVSHEISHTFKRRPGGYLDERGSLYACLLKELCEAQGRVGANVLCPEPFVYFKRGELTWTRLGWRGNLFYRRQGRHLARNAPKGGRENGREILAFHVVEHPVRTGKREVSCRARYGVFQCYTTLWYSEFDTSSG